MRIFCPTLGLMRHRLILNMALVFKNHIESLSSSPQLGGNLYSPMFNSNLPIPIGSSLFSLPFNEQVANSIRSETEKLDSEKWPVRLTLIFFSNLDSLYLFKFFDDCFRKPFFIYQIKKMGLENNPLENSERVLPQQILQPSDSSEDEEENETDFAPSGYALLPRHWFEKIYKKIIKKVEYNFSPQFYFLFVESYFFRLKYVTFIKKYLKWNSQRTYARKFGWWMRWLRYRKGRVSTLYLI